MEFIWSKSNVDEYNYTLAFCIRREGLKNGVLRLYAGQIYRVFADGKLVSYGPERTASGYTRERRIKVGKAKTIVVEVAAYNVACYANALERPYFAAELFDEDRLVAKTKDFLCKRITDRIQRVQRMSYQRNFLEYYDQSFDKSVFYLGEFSVYPDEETSETDSPILLEGNADPATYAIIQMRLVREGTANIDQHAAVPTRYIWWEDFTDEGKMDGFTRQKLEADLVCEISKIKCFCEGDLSCFLFDAGCIRTGLIGIEAEVEEESTVYAVFDGLLEKTEGGEDVVFCRPVFHNAAAWRLTAGKYNLLTFEPYDMRYLKIIVRGKVKICRVYLREISNGEAKAELSGAGDMIGAVFEAGKNSFCQNAVDIFTDCPGRERAGWLCDSFFTARAEQLLTGKNTIEKNFLENFILSAEDNLPEGMLPMCYPARQRDGTFIPNWAMWFVIQLKEYYDRTGDRLFLDKAKKRVYSLIKYFSGLQNEYGLLENVPGWVFVEWSRSNDYTGGVNFPTNMLYAYMLSCAADMYGDDFLRAQSSQIQAYIAENAFNGSFFVDNAVRNQKGELVNTANISETCQYYALFCKIPCGADFKAKMRDVFGPRREKGKFDEVAHSNAFIGNYLRLLWLLSEGEFAVAKRECTDYFYYMAERTGTLWEYQSTEASCNHGFTSVICCIIAEFLFGYRGFSARDRLVYFDQKYDKESEASIVLPVGEGTVRVVLKDGKREIINDSFYDVRFSR